MQTDTYHARLRAQQAEWRLLKGDERSERATRAAARSALRWADSEAKPDQQRRAGRLELIHCAPEPDVPTDKAPTQTQLPLDAG